VAAAGVGAADFTVVVSAAEDFTVVAAFAVVEAAEPLAEGSAAASADFTVVAHLEAERALRRQDAALGVRVLLPRRIAAHLAFDLQG
jgi:hypothetical protein